MIYSDKIVETVSDLPALGATGVADEMRDIEGNEFSVVSGSGGGPAGRCLRLHFKTLMYSADLSPRLAASTQALQDAVLERVGPRLPRRPRLDKPLVRP